jgi:glycosyltransferase involved in cell wall biosynthesis
MKIAIIVDWLVTYYAGSERTLEQILKVYPESDLYCIVDFMGENERHCINNKEVNTSFIQNLPFSKKLFRTYLPLMPLAIEQFNLNKYDLIISLCHSVSKGVLTQANQLHICYCLTPPRYVWDLYQLYLEESGLNKGLKGILTKLILHYMRIWDSTTANRVNYFMSSSKYISKRIKKIYARDSHVIYPPVYIDDFEICNKKDNIYLTVSRMVPYKKVDLIVDAFSQMPDKKLIVIGQGPFFKKIKSMSGSNIEILGHQPFNILKNYLQKAKAFVFAAEEDFGILPVEAQACGTPVIAFGRGGVTETVIEGKTGIFFKNQTIEDLINAVNKFENNEHSFNPEEIKDNTKRFSKDIFRSEFKSIVDRKINEFF